VRREHGDAVRHRLAKSADGLPQKHRSLGLRRRKQVASRVVDDACVQVHAGSGAVGKGLGHETRD
jgi:hypothetical protein